MSEVPADYSLPETDDALLAECEVQVFKATGPGGQGVNTTDSAVRLIHRPTGIVVVGRRERSQLRNKLDCLKRLRKKHRDSPNAPSPAASRQDRPVPPRPEGLPTSHRCRPRSRHAANRCQRSELVKCFFFLGLSIVLSIVLTILLNLILRLFNR